MQTKICNKCGLEKSTEEFSPHRRTCKACKSIYYAMYRKLNHDKELKRHHKYYAENRERENLKSNKRGKRRDIALGRWAYNSIRDHVKKGFDVKITAYELERIAEKTIYCPLCCMPIKWEGGNGWKPNSPTLDRINNDKTITKYNTWVICHRCNVTKQDRKMQDFIAYCKTVAEKFG